MLTAAFLLAVAAPVWAQSAAPAPAAVEITAEPSHHLIAESEYARWFRVEVAPHATTLMHHHAMDYFYVVIGDARIENQVAGGGNSTLAFADGEVRFKEGNFAHAAKSLGETPFRNVTIELKQKGHAEPKSGEGMVNLAPGVVRRHVALADGVRVTEFRLAPGAVIPLHHHDAPHLAVALTELTLENVTANGGTTARLKPGDATWVKAGVTHSLKNAGSNEAKFLTFEWQ